MIRPALVLAFMALPASGQERVTCVPRAMVVDRLAVQYGETRRGIGLASGGSVVEVWASDETGSWTVTVTLPDKRTCMVAMGQHWEDRMDDLAHLGDDEG